MVILVPSNLDSVLDHGLKGQLQVLLGWAHIMSVQTGTVPEAAMATETNSIISTLGNIATAIMHASV